MAFDEVQFPTSISKGSRGGPGFRHSVLTLDSGALSPISRWPNARRKYDVRYGLRTIEDLTTVYEFYLGRDGVSRGFRFQDPLDYTTASDHRGAVDDEDVTIGSGDGSTTQFQLKKTYTSGARTVTRTIEKPQSGTVVVALDGSAQTEGVDFTVDTSTGLITFTTAPTGGGSPQTITAGFKFDVPVMFSEEIDDVLEISLDEYEAGAIPSIPLVEMVGDVSSPEPYYRGGGSSQSISGTTLYDYSWGATVAIDPDANNLKVVLPDINQMEDGGPHFTFLNLDASHSILFVNRATGTTEFTVLPLTGAQVYVATIATVKTWVSLKGT